MAVYGSFKDGRLSLSFFFFFIFKHFCYWDLDLKIENIKTKKIFRFLKPTSVV